VDPVDPDPESDPDPQRWSTGAGFNDLIKVIMKIHVTNTESFPIQHRATEEFHCTVSRESQCKVPYPSWITMLNSLY
jgi:hypothetical protein